MSGDLINFPKGKRVAEAPPRELFDSVVMAVKEGEYDFKNCPTRTNKVGPIYQQDVIAALIFCGGILADVGRILGRRRTSIKEVIDKDADLWELFQEIKEESVDQIESVIFNAAKDGDVPAGKFILQTIGKERGYSTRVETTGKDGGAVEYEVRPSDEMKRKLDDLNKKLSISNAIEA